MKKFWILAILLCAGIYLCGHSSLTGDNQGTEGMLERIDDLNNSRYSVGVPLGGKASSRPCGYGNADALQWG